MCYSPKYGDNMFCFWHVLTHPKPSWQQAAVIWYQIFVGIIPGCIKTNQIHQCGMIWLLLFNVVSIHFKNIYYIYFFYFSGWWYTYPSKQYESQLWWLFPLYGKIKNDPNHQPEIYELRWSFDLLFFFQRSIFSRLAKKMVQWHYAKKTDDERRLKLSTKWPSNILTNLLKI